MSRGNAALFVTSSMCRSRLPSPGIKRFDRQGNQKIALPLLTNAFSSCSAAHAFGLVKRMGNMVRQRRLVENPLFIGSGETLRQRQRQRKEKDG